MSRKLDFGVEHQRGRVRKHGFDKIGSDATMSRRGVPVGSKGDGRRIHRIASGLSYQPSVQFAPHEHEVKPDADGCVKTSRKQKRDNRANTSTFSQKAKRIIEAESVTQSMQRDVKRAVLVEVVTYQVNRRSLKRKGS